MRGLISFLYIYPIIVHAVGFTFVMYLIWKILAHLAMTPEYNIRFNVFKKKKKKKTRNIRERERGSTIIYKNKELMALIECHPWLFEWTIEISALSKCISHYLSLLLVLCRTVYTLRPWKVSHFSFVWTKGLWATCQSGWNIDDGTIWSLANHRYIRFAICIITRGEVGEGNDKEREEDIIEKDYIIFVYNL